MLLKRNLPPPPPPPLAENTDASVDNNPITTDENNSNNKRRKLLDRTLIFHSMDPLLHVRVLNNEQPDSANRKKRAMPATQPVVLQRKHVFQPVTILGPLQDAEDARKVQEIWKWKSRAILPRIVYAKVIADHFGLQVWHQLDALLGLEHFDVVHRDQDVYLQRKRAMTTIAECNDNAV